MAEAVSASEASTHFLNSLDARKARDERLTVERFVEWLGAEQPISRLTAEKVAAYAEREQEGGEASLEPVRAFLAYCARLAFTDENLVVHLHLGHAEGAAAEAIADGGYRMTIEGVELLESELAEFKARRPQIAEQLRAAMQDKDFRENAPLDAARDEQAHLEARIREVEHRLRSAVIIDQEAKAGRANVGSTVKVLNLEANSEHVFHLVSSSEVDPGQRQDFDRFAVWLRDDQPWPGRRDHRACTGWRAQAARARGDRLARYGRRHRRSTERARNTRLARRTPTCGAHRSRPGEAGPDDPHARAS